MRIVGRFHIEYRFLPGKGDGFRSALMLARRLRFVFVLSEFLVLRGVDYTVNK